MGIMVGSFLINGWLSHERHRFAVGFLVTVVLAVSFVSKEFQGKDLWYLVAGHGGAEKQLVYLAKALAQAGIEVRVYCLTRGEPYEGVLQKEGISIDWFGQFDHPILRVFALINLFRDFRPHFIHSVHFYTNLYAALASRFSGGVAIGSLRSDLDYELSANGFWGPWLLIDLQAYDRQAAQPFSYRLPEGRIWVATVARLIEAKRLDRFLRILSRVRQHIPTVGGIIAGDGGLRQHLERQAMALGLIPDGVQFLGHCETVPALLSHIDVFMMTSDHEGFPNGLLEAMAAGLPVVTTSAGDASKVIQDGINGFVIPREDEDAFVDKVMWLAQHPQLRQTMGAMGRQMVATAYSYTNFGKNVLDLYQRIAYSLNLPRVALLVKA
jgi:glycosyltransferase involved in cell wall biosynthesis